MPLSRFVGLMGFALAVGLALGGGRWVVRPLLLCWSVAAERADDDTETAGTVSGKLSASEVEAKFPWRLSDLTKEDASLARFDSGEWAAREAKRRCGVLALLLGVCVGGSFYAAKWVSKREDDCAIYAACPDQPKSPPHGRTNLSNAELEQ